MDEKMLKSKLLEGYIHIRVIMEVVGKPKEYVEESLLSYIKKIKEDDSYAISKEHIEKAEKQEQDLYSAFAELEILVKDSMALLSFCFDYMPSSVEIIEPERMIIPNNVFTGFTNDMLSRMHTLNTGIIDLTEKNQFYIRNTAVLLRNFLVVLLSSKPLDIGKLHTYLGVQKEDILKVINILIKEGKIKKHGELYSAIEK